MRLRTLGTPALLESSGSVLSDEPSLVALLAMLAVAGDVGVEADELMLCLTPDATSDRARNELDRLLALARHVTGDHALIAHPGSRYVMRPDAIMLDVDVLPATSDSECHGFLAGFAVNDSPEFAEWRASVRRRVQPTMERAAASPVAATMPNARARAGWRAIAVFAGILAAGAVAAWFQVAASRPVAGFTAGDPVLLADLANETGDTMFDRGILSAASVALQQSGHLRLYSRSRLPAVYQLMRIRDRDTALTYELAQEVAERDHVRFVLGLRLFRDPGGYRIAARLADVTLGEEVAENSEPAERESDVIAALDRVLLNMRKRLGESREDLRTRRHPLPLVTTTSLGALRSYAEGNDAWRAGNFPLAGEAWRRAVDLDTGFAAAFAALGNWHYYHHDRAQGERYFADALTRSERLTEWERLRLLEGLAQYRGNLDSALTLSSVIATRFPNVVTWYNYGTALMQRNRHAEAIVALNTALSFDSLHVNSYINIATSAKALERNEEALRNYLKGNAIDSTVLYRNNLNHEWGGVYVRLGRLGDAESAFRKMMAGRRLQDRALGMRSMAYLALWQGRFGQAIDFFGQAAEASTQTNAVLGEARNRLLLITAFRAASRTAEANDEATRVLAMIRSPLLEPYFLALLAMHCVDLGRLRDADAVLRVIRARVNTENELDRTAAAVVAGALSLARNRPDSALATFDAVKSTTALWVYLGTLRARALLGLGRGDAARAELETVLKTPRFGTDDQYVWQQAFFDLGELLQSRGDALGAAAAYRRYLQQWRDAPAALPRLVTARVRLAALER